MIREISPQHHPYRLPLCKDCSPVQVRFILQNNISIFWGGGLCIPTGSAEMCCVLISLSERNRTISLCHQHFHTVNMIKTQQQTTQRLPCKSSNEKHLDQIKKDLHFASNSVFLHGTTVYRLCGSSVEYNQLFILQLFLMLSLTLKCYLAWAFLPFGIIQSR